MKDKNRNQSFWKNCWTDILLITIISVFFAANIDLSRISPSVLYKSSDSEESFTTDLFFRISNSSGEPRIIPDITLINIDSLKTREEIAKLITQVLSMNPKVIGVDVSFPKKGDTTGDSMLIVLCNNDKVIKKCVFANDYNIKDKELPKVSHSFFLNGSDSYREGFTNFVYDEKYMNVRQYRLEKETCEGKQLSLSYRMVTSVNGNYDLSNNGKNGLGYIDYRLKSFNELSPYQLDSNMIRDKWVLVGSLSKSHDIYNTPIGIMPGLKIHAYTLESILEGNRIHPSAPVWDWIILTLVCFFSVLGLVYVDFVIIKSENAIRGIILREGVFTFILVLLQVSVLMFGAYLLFEYLDLFFNMQSSLNGALFVVAVVKSLHSIIMALLYKSKIAKSVLGYFMYYSQNDKS